MNPIKEPLLWVSFVVAGLALLIASGGDEASTHVGAVLGGVAAVIMVAAGARTGLRAAKFGRDDHLDRRAAEVGQALPFYAAEVALAAQREVVQATASMPGIASAAVACTAVSAVADGLRGVAPRTRDRAAVTGVADSAAAQVTPYIERLADLHQRALTGLGQQAEQARSAALEDIRQAAAVRAASLFRQEQQAEAERMEHARAETARQQAAAAEQAAAAQHAEALRMQEQRRMEEQRAAAERAEAERLRVEREAYEEQRRAEEEEEEEEEPPVYERAGGAPPPPPPPPRSAATDAVDDDDYDDYPDTDDDYDDIDDDDDPFATTSTAPGGDEDDGW